MREELNRRLGFQVEELRFGDMAAEKYLLPLLFAVTALFLLGWWRRRRAHRSLHEGSTAAESRLAGHSPKPRLVGDLPILLVWLVFVGALVAVSMRPVAPSSTLKVKERAVKVAAVWDVSKSTSAEDYRNSLRGPNGEVGELTAGPFGSRLQTAVFVFREHLLPSLGGAPVCFVTYRGEGWRLTPTFTSDYSALSFIERHYLREGMAPGEGSDISRGLTTALDQLDRFRQPGTREVILLFSDGGFTGEVSEDPTTKQKLTRNERLEKATKRIKDNKIGLVVIGVGLKKPLPIPQYQQDREGRWQRTGVLRDGADKDAPAILTSYEDSALKSLAQRTGGLYHHIEDPNAKVEVDWQKTLGEDMVDRSETQVFQEVLLPAICILALAYLLRFIFR